MESLHAGQPGEPSSIRSVQALRVAFLRWTHIRQVFDRKGNYLFGGEPSGAALATLFKFCSALPSLFGLAKDDSYGWAHCLGLLSVGVSEGVAYRLGMWGGRCACFDAELPGVERARTDCWAGGASFKLTFPCRFLA